MTACLTSQPTDLRGIATQVRRHVVDMCAGPEGGHLGGSLSCTDILVALYFAVLRVDPDTPGDPDRDIFLLSKGHGALALYATLAERGFLPVAELAGYGRPGSRLMAHPVRAVPGVELPTGSLGHGLALGLGFALAARLAGTRTAGSVGQPAGPEPARPAGRRRCAFVLLGDGELQEGSCWEAALGAAAQRADNLVAIVDRNGLQLTGATEQIAPLEPLAERWRSFGWAAREVDGHDHGALVEALSSVPWVPGRPSVLVASTVKGQGVPMVAGQVRSHFATLSDRTCRQALRALEGSS
jgi:transketolase